VRAGVNDSGRSVAEADFSVQQARAEVAGALEALALADKRAERATALATGLAPPLEASRAKSERSRRRQVLMAAHERWRVAAAELTRLLRLQPGLIVEPLEPVHLEVCLIDLNQSIDDLI